MNARTKFNLTTTPACVLADGPQEIDGDGGYEFVVCFGDVDGEPITENYDCIWKVFEFEEAQQFAHELARRYHLELVFECNYP